MISSYSPKSAIQKRSDGTASISVFSDHGKSIPSVSISDITGSINGNPVSYGDLVVIGNGIGGTKITIDGSGSLVIVGDPLEVVKYSLNENGHLTYQE